MLPVAYFQRFSREYYSAPLLICIHWGLGSSASNSIYFLPSKPMLLIRLYPKSPGQQLNCILVDAICNFYFRPKIVFGHWRIRLRWIDVGCHVHAEVVGLNQQCVDNGEYDFSTILAGISRHSRSAIGIYIAIFSLLPSLRSLASSSSLKGFLIPFLFFGLSSLDGFGQNISLWKTI